MTDPTFGADAASVAARCGSDTLRLEPEWPTILRWMRYFGRVVARTENRYAFVAQPGRFERLDMLARRRAFLGGDFALACRLERWRTIFATIDDAGRRDLRMFDTFGEAIGTIEVDDVAGRSGFDEMVWRLHARDQSTQERTFVPFPQPERPDTEVDVARLDHALSRTQTPAERALVLRTFGVTREQSFRLGVPHRARRVHVGFVRALLATLVERRGGVACAIVNTGATHTHAGRLLAFDGVARWTATFASQAKLTIDAASIARAWIVRAPRAFGSATSIELFGGSGEKIVSLSGVLDGEGRQSADWRRSIAGLAPDLGYAGT